MPEQQYQRDNKPIPSISPRSAWQLMTESGATLIDVREPSEYSVGHAEGAISIPLSVLGERHQEIPRVGDTLLICHVGQRSLTAAAFMRRQGWERVFNVEGGTDQWAAAGLPMRYATGQHAG
ncbi:MAG: rhodanese-like domain-containing protein [Ktedonobacterales bacterium]